MWFWSFYFFGEIFLGFMGAIRFDYLLNILLACFLLPLPKRASRALGARRVETLRFLIALPAAIMLLWHETWFPGPAYAFRALTGANAMSAGYMLQFVLRNLNPLIIAGLIALFVFCLLASKRYDFSYAVILLMLVLLPFKSPGGRAPGDYLESFHRSEAGRVAGLEKAGAGASTSAPDFDILILHI